MSSVDKMGTGDQKKMKISNLSIGIRGDKADNKSSRFNLQLVEQCYVYATYKISTKYSSFLGSQKLIQAP